MCSRWRRVWMSIACAVYVVWTIPGVRAQDTTPLSCWWRPDKIAVHVGEPFGLTLTCQVMESASVRVVPNLTEVEPTSIELTPFEILGGIRHQDIVAAPWRYVQFAYTIRLLGEDFFGRDVAIPSMNVTFRVQARGEEAVEGNERQYVLPAMPMHILSLVPAEAADIQDPAIDTFGDLEARRSRASMELVAAFVLFGFAAVLAAVAALRVRERFRKAGPLVTPTASVGAVLAECMREAERVRAEALRDGWSSSLAAQAIAPFRVAGALALKQPVAQTEVTSDTPTREGQIALSHGLLRRRRALVSAPITAASIDRLRGASKGHRQRAATQDVVDSIRDALLALNAVRYGRERNVDVQSLDLTLTNGSRALRRLRRSATPFGIGAWLS